MVDTIDKANADYERWLNGKIKQCQITPANDITECVDCGGEIGEKRKQAVPYAVRCVACQSEFERGK
ncbi:MAG: TraR/DksA C4-type zinc finger protein [Moraxella sp.]|nr:TraR/DksA C4-type zinc finger protein [Moraxella sp.]